MTARCKSEEILESGTQVQCGFDGRICSLSLACMRAVEGGLFVASRDTSGKVINQYDARPAIARPARKTSPNAIRVIGGRLFDFAIER